MKKTTYDLCYGIFILIFLISGNIFSQTCDGYTFISPGQPSPSTYTYTASGWIDEFGNPTTVPTNIGASESVSILADNSVDVFGNVFGTFFVATDVAYSGNILAPKGIMVVEGTVSFSGVPNFNGAILYIDVNGAVTIPGDLSPSGSTTINNAGELNIGGDLSGGGNLDVINYPNSKLIVQGGVATNGIFSNCGLLEVVTGDLDNGGSGTLKNLCTIYVHTNMNLSGDFTNDGLLIVDGDINFNGSSFYNNDIIVINNLFLNNDDLIGNNDTSILIVRNSAELNGGATITGHWFYDLDDGGGFDLVCGACTEDVRIIYDIILPSDTNDLISSCDGNIIFTFLAPEAFIDFDGVDDYIDSPLDLSGATQGTYMAWVKLDPSFTSSGVVLGQGDFEISVNGGTNNLKVKLNDAVLDLPVSTALTLNEWAHIAFVYNASDSTEKYKVYINGQQEGFSNHTSLSSGINTSLDQFTIGKASNAAVNYFKGAIDEVRIFDNALTEDQLQQIVYQEIQDVEGNVTGTIVPKPITDLGTSAMLSWSNLKAYYPMTDIIPDGKTSDFSGNNIIATLYNITSIQEQSAPMPYKTAVDGDWSQESTWLHGDVWDIQDEPNNKDWSIIEIKNNISTSNRHGTIGLLINSGAKLTINGNVELRNDWYLKLDGEIDLEGESQLIQGADSELDATSAGIIERDQQGTADLYSYNYWAAPVGVTSIISNNNNYTLPDVLNDGTSATTPLSINWITSGYDGTSGSPVGIADYWIWKYANQISDDYPSWQHVRSTGSLQPGEGYTMKGTTDTSGAILTEQNYVYNGKPHNGDITLTLSAGNDYLIGNPYASAIDADEFILDNVSDGAGRAASNIIDGALYFWEHFASSTHILSEYQGGYGIYTLIGGTAAINNDIRINHTGSLTTSKGAPEQYIPVGQGFFVTADTGGTVTFKNSQRTFKTESSDPSIFMRAAGSKKDKANSYASRSGNTDLRKKIRLMFDSPKGYHRQLLVGVDPNATDNHDIGYDAPLIEDNVEDMYWAFDSNKFVIQGVSDFNDNKALALGVKIDQEGDAIIRIGELENIPSNRIIYLHDKELEIYHDLTESDYKITLTVGEYLDRFEIVFDSKEQEEEEEVVIENTPTNFNVHYSNNIKSIIIINPNTEEIKSLKMLNILGQIIYKNTSVPNENYTEFKIDNLQTGTYIINIETNKETIIKKVIVE